MKKIVMTPNPYRDRNFRYAKEAETILHSVGIETKTCLAFDVDKDFELPETLELYNLQKELVGADAMICFGGDGTILHASKAAAAANVPILGVNIGTMGFMAELESSEMELLKKLGTDDYTLDERMMLTARLMRDGRCLYEESALNDIVVTKGAVSRVVQACVLCDGVEALNFSGDGVIIATPTGSTAYSMSAGGPIVEPSADSILITPICAHNTQARSVVLSGSRAIDISMGRINRRSALLSVDGGKAQRVFTGDRILVNKAEKTTKLIKLKDKRFFEIIKNKLNG